MTNLDVLIPYESGSVSDQLDLIALYNNYVLIPYESGSVSDSCYWQSS